MLPLLRLDGYYVLSDLTGVPDLFMRIKPTLKSLAPWKSEAKADELKRWVRAAVTLWVVVLLPTLGLIFGLMIFNAPRIFATAWDSFAVHYDKASSAFGGGSMLRGAISSGQMVMLALPAAGLAYSSSRAGSRALMGGWRWSRGSAARRLGFVVGTATALALMGFVWWPNGEYKPIQRQERGTVQGAVAQFAAFTTGRPGLPEEREKELGGAPFESKEGTVEQPSEEPGSTRTTGTSTNPTETSTNPTETTTTPATTEPTTTEPTTTAPTTTTTP
jgi:putative peptide zinc metalloprotease protein